MHHEVKWAALPKWALKDSKEEAQNAYDVYCARTGKPNNSKAYPVFIGDLPVPEPAFALSRLPLEVGCRALFRAPSTLYNMYLCMMSFGNSITVDMDAIYEKLEGAVVTIKSIEESGVVFYDGTGTRVSYSWPKEFFTRVEDV